MTDKSRDEKDEGSRRKPRKGGASRESLETIGVAITGVTLTENEKEQVQVFFANMLGIQRDGVILSGDE